MSKQSFRGNFVPRAYSQTPRTRQLHAARPGLRMAALALAIGLSAPLYAQSITGGLHGTAQIPVGAVVVVTNPATGYTRSIGVDSNGRYDLGLLAPGHYDVSIVKDGKTLGEHTVKVSPNVSSPVPAFTLSSTGENTTDLTVVRVNAQTYETVVNPIDVSTSQLSTTWDAHLLHQLPVDQQSIYAIPLLDSGARAATIQGSNLPQVLGAGPTENRYYFNEFDTTYDVTGVGATVFPQEAIGNTQFIRGNGGAEWTSTTGAILSATLKQGTNEFHAGYSAYYAFPTSDLLNPAGKDTYYTVNGNRNHYLYQSDDRSDAHLQQYLWASGPAIKDKLFYFVLLGNEPAYTNTNYSSTQKTDTSYRNKRALLNVTWNLTDSQSLDVAGYKHWYGYSSNAYNLATAYTPSSASDQSKWSGLEQKQKLLIGNYHWYINDDMSLRLMAGYMRYDYLASNAFGDEPWASIYYGQTGVTQALAGGSSAYAPYDYYYAKRGFKGDFSWNLGDHKLTLGAEKYTVIYHFVPETNPNGTYQYYDYSGLGYGGYGLGNGGVIPASGLYGYTYVFKGGGSFDSHNNGYYLFDHWQATSNLVLTGGLRLDQMKNEASNGVTYLSMTTLSPRLGVSWDVHGDSSLKIGANAGKYTLPMPSTLSYAAASAETYYYDYYGYTGINADGTPIGYQKLGDTVTISDGSVPQLSTIASRNIKNTSQYEFQLYAQQQLTPTWSVMASADAHILKNLIDETCDNTGVISDYVRANGHPNYAGLARQCLEFNPGKDIVLRDYLDADGTLSNITIPNAYLRMPAASRKYYGLTLKLSHARTTEEPYFLHLSYTWGHLYGNSDGYANLTKGSDPTPGYSGNYTYREFTAGNSGNLAGDIRHQLVASGVYYLGGGFRVSGVFTAHTGTPYTCLGTYPDPNNSDFNGQGAVTHYCGGKLVPEGSTGRAPTYWQLDLGLGYDLDMGKAGQLSIDLQMTNVTNRSGVTSRAMTADNGQFANDGSLAPAPTYFTISGMQAPRATMLNLRYRY